MKSKVLSIIFIAMTFLISSNVLARETPTIGIVGFTNRVEITNIDGNIIESFENASEYLYYGLVICEKLNVMDISPEVERFRLNELVMQLDKSTVDCKRFGTDYLIFGYLTNLSVKVAESGFTNLKDVSVEGKSETVCANLSAKIVDAKNGRIVLTVTGKGESSSGRVDAQLKEHKLKVGKFNVTRDCVLNAIEKACDEISAKITEAV